MRLRYATSRVELPPLRLWRHPGGTLKESLEAWSVCCSAVVVLAGVSVAELSWNTSWRISFGGG